MLVSALAIVLSLAPQFTFAHNKRAASSTTLSAQAATHSINVGADGLKFTPDSVTASVGDIILFRFYPQNHSVARSDYLSPCIPYELTGAGRQGFWSGFEPINVVLSNPPTFQVMVNDTSPIFFYCSAPGACVHDGMVGVINPNSTQTLATQKLYAENSTLALSPGEGFPVEGAPTSTPTSTLGATNTSPPPVSASSQPPLSAGAIAGIAVGGSAVLLLGAALVYFCGRQRTVKEILQTQAVPRPTSYQPGAAHMSLASSAGYLPKYSNLSVDPMGPMGPHSFSSQGMYDQPSGAETESYRSRSPPLDETRESMMSHINYSGSPGTTSPGRVDSPPGRLPVTPGRPNLLPIEEMYQPLGADVLPALRFNRVPSQTGPHELSTENDNANSLYQPVPPPRDERRDSLLGRHHSSSG